MLIKKITESEALRVFNSEILPSIERNAIKQREIDCARMILVMAEKLYFGKTKATKRDIQRTRDFGI
jgi:hypothetical protein